MTTFLEQQEYQKQYYQLQDSVISDILAKLPEPKYHEFLHSAGLKKDIDPILIESYNNIRADSWPKCLSVDDFYKLPKHILEECRTVHKLYPLMWEDGKINIENWKNYQGGAYSIQDLIRFQTTILDNIEYITDKKVIDFASHAGEFSLLSLHSGASSVVATNVRQEYLDIASECMELAGYKDKFKALFADLHDYELNTKLCKNVDTVLLFGILYHLHDHMLVLDSIARATPKTIIIETAEDSDIIDNPNPLVYWSEEFTSTWRNAWQEGKEKVFVGVPNKAWIDAAMDSLDYVPVSYKRYDCFFLEKIFKRSTYVYTYQPQHRKSLKHLSRNFII